MKFLPRTKPNIPAGLVSVGLGLLTFVFLINNDDTGKLISNNYRLFLSNYFLIILFVFGGLYFVAIGILLIIGCVVPDKTSPQYHAVKAIHNSIVAILFFPISISATTLVIEGSDSFFWKAFFLGVSCYTIILLFQSSWAFIKNIDNYQQNGSKP